MSTTPTTTVELCDSCGKPAAYRSTRDHEHRCEPCAIRYGYELRGDAYTAQQVLGFAISLLRRAGLDDAAIAGMVQATLTSPHSTGRYTFGADQFLPGPDRIEDRPWMASHTPIEAA